MYVVQEGRHLMVSTHPCDRLPPPANIPIACGVWQQEEEEEEHARTFTLQALSVPTHLRGRGIGSRLLSHIAAECHARGGQCMELDDMSDRCRRQDNIYVKHGFRYRHASGPEMYASPRHVRNA